MSPYLNVEAVATAIAEEMIRVCSARFGAEATSAPTDVPAAAGFTVTVPVAGAASGRVVVWFDRESAAACARFIAGGTETPDESAIQNIVRDLAREAVAAVAARGDAGGVEFGEPVIGAGSVSTGARAYYVAVPNTVSCLLAVDVDRSEQSTARNDVARLDAVLDVELPLIVRFGRTVLSLQAVGDLGPGSVIDMNRSPDEPVDLLVGDRVIGRGEVVVVGGNYGVRITSLSAGRDALVNKEARAI